MATSGTTDFTLDFTEIAEEAFERANPNKEMKWGYQLRTARRSMNLLTIEWQNKGINMWTIEEGSVPLLTGQKAYTLPADTVDLMDVVLRQGSGVTQNDLTITRLSAPQYSTIPNKLTTGRPVNYWIRRAVDAPEITVWPLPQNDNYSLQYWRMRRIEDAGDGVETPDISYRFLPVIVAGLAYYLAMKDTEATPRIPMLKAEYDAQFAMAASEDREKSTWRLVPRIAR